MVRAWIYNPPWLAVTCGFESRTLRTTFPSLALMLAERKPPNTPIPCHGNTRVRLMVLLCQGDNCP